MVRALAAAGTEASCRPRVTAFFLSASIITLFFMLHLTLYDTAVYELQVASGSPPISVNQAITYPTHVHFPRTSRRLPQAIIIGVRKCGTRALLEMLFLHPRIQKAAGEVHFFDRDDNYAKGLDWYRRKMPHSFRDQVTIEKSPSYFVIPEVQFTNALYKVCANYVQDILTIPRSNV